MFRLPLAALLTLAALAFAGPASAEQIVELDNEGRTIRFDVRTSGVDTKWHANLLRKAAHGDEISKVTIRIVDPDGLRRECTAVAAGCYERNGGRGLIVVPAGESSANAHTLIHEYGHHVDASRRHGGLSEPNGTPLWWKARGAARLVELKSVARTYRIGWERSIAEIFAEDYAYVNLGGRYRIDWLEKPDQTVRRAILADIGVRAAPPSLETRAPALKPVVIKRSGTLSPSERDRVSFGLLGPDRRVKLTAAFTGPKRTGASAQVVVTCGRQTVTRTLTPTQRAVTFGFQRIGPADCTAELVNSGSGAESYRMTVRLTIQNAAAALPTA